MADVLHTFPLVTTDTEPRRDTNIFQMWNLDLFEPIFLRWFSPSGLVEITFTQRTIGHAFLQKVKLNWILLTFICINDPALGKKYMVAMVTTNHFALQTQQHVWQWKTLLSSLEMVRCTSPTAAKHYGKEGMRRVKGCDAFTPPKTHLFCADGIQRKSKTQQWRMDGCATKQRGNEERGVNRKKNNDKKKERKWEWPALFPKQLQRQRHSLLASNM